MTAKAKGRMLTDGAGLQRGIVRLAEQILARDSATDDLAVIGIRRRGVPIARRICEEIERRTGKRALSGVLDITLYRDDLSQISPQPVVSGTEIDFDLNRKRVVLVDDVLFTGRTIRAAIDELIDFGRPKRVELAVLVDRGWRELPIEANYVAEKVETTLGEVIKVHVREIDGEDFIEVVPLEEEQKA